MVDRDPKKFALLRESIHRVFAQIGSEGHYQSEAMYALIDSVLNVETVFLHVAVATGAERILYHGDDEYTPETFRAHLGRQVLGERFDIVNKEVLWGARRELSELFPSAWGMLRDETIASETRRSVALMAMTLVDILVSLRTQSRLILFNPQEDLQTASKYLPAQDLLQVWNMVQAFERLNGAIVLPNTKTALAGLQKANFFGSPEYVQYSQAHEELAVAESDASKTIGRPAAAVTKLKSAFDSKLESSSATYVTAASSLKCNTSPRVRCCDGRATNNIQATQA
jgi:hypothetical protein